MKHKWLYCGGLIVVGCAAAKLFGLIDWPWWLVLSPVIIASTFVAVALLVVGFILWRLHRGGWK